MNEIDELRELIGPGFQTTITAAYSPGGSALEFALDLIAISVPQGHGTGHADAYVEITQAFGDLYARLMSTAQRWTVTGDPDVRVRFVVAEPALWNLGGTLIKLATYYVQGEGSIILVRTSRD